VLNSQLLNNASLNKPGLSACPYEKIYIHTDRNFYSAGEDIWFKAYLVEAFSNQLINHSEVVYVEFISADSLILEQKVIRLVDGLGKGDFHISDSIVSGRYYIRAYTNYMRNFGAEFFYLKQIAIKNFKVSDLSPFIKIEKKELIDIQFFPEGGSLVNGVRSKVAFKAVNSSGLGCNVSGYIITSNGDTVTSFQSEHLGMGYFYLRPDRDITYYAKGTSRNGLGFRCEIPPIFDIGIVMRVFVRDTSLILDIGTNKETISVFGNASLVLEGVFRNQKIFEAPVSFVKPRYYIPINSLPDGILKLTIYSGDKLPHCERLVFIKTTEELTLNIKTNKESYSPREKVRLELLLKNNLLKTECANLSLAVVNENVFTSSGMYASDIATWFLLESEISGFIEQPGYYFDYSNPMHQKHLDLLLLTQGWRDFRWKYLPDAKKELSYLPENGLAVTGRLRNKLINKPIEEANITLTVFSNDSRQILISQTDSFGVFSFKNIHFNGKSRIIASATNEKYKNTGWLLLDPPSYSLPEVRLPAKIDSKTEQEVQKKIEQDALKKHRILEMYSLSDTIALDEIIVKGSNKRNNLKDGNFRKYGSPDHVISVNESNSTYTDIFNLLQGRIPGLEIEGFYPNISVSIRKGGTPLFLLDGMEVDIEWIATIPLDMVDKVEVLKNGGSTSAFGFRGSNGVISVFTKKDYEPVNMKVFHTVNKEVTGYSESRLFYSPNYKVPKPEHKKPDLRSTIYWAPDITLRNYTPVQIDFYNTDIPTKCYIDIQGLSSSGIPISAKVIYKVE
jgi:hypothetical protein